MNAVKTEGGLLLTGHGKFGGLLLIMTTITKFSKNDTRLSMLIERRNLSDNAIKNYDTVFKEIYVLFDVTPSDIVRMGK